MKKEIKTKVLGTVVGDHEYFYVKELPCVVGTEVTISWEVPDSKHTCDKMPERNWICSEGKSDERCWSIGVVTARGSIGVAFGISVCPWCEERLDV